MKSLCKRLTSFLLVLSMMVSMVPLAYAEEEQDTGDSAEIAVSQEMADQLMDQMFGGASGEAVKTEEGYQYQVPAELFSSLTDQLPGAETEEAEEDPNRLSPDFVDNSNEAVYAMLEELKGKAPTLMAGSGTTKVDVVFIIDSTGSMGDEISNVKSNVSSFASYLAEKDITLRLGLIDYEDITCDGADSTIVHSYGHSNWMNVSQFLEAMTGVVLGYGGDAPETPIDALAHLTNGSLSWSSDSYKFAVLITDADYKTNNNHGISGMSDMITRLQKANIQVTTITPSGYYDEYGNLAGLTGGVQINLYGDFAAALREYADAVIGGANDTQDYTVRVLETSTKTPVKSATITWDGGSVTTNAEGMAVITTRNNPIRNVTVSRAGYETLTYTSLDLEKSGMITLTPGVDTSEDAPDDGVPVLKPSHFKNPSSGSAKMKGPSVTILGREINFLEKLSVKFEFDIFGANVNISNNHEEKKFEVIVAKEWEGDGKAKDGYWEQGGYWEESYSQYKAMVDKFTDFSAQDIYNQFRSLRKNAKSQATFGFPLDVSVGGYATVSYASGVLDWDTIEGGVVIGASTRDKSVLKDRKLFSYPLPPAPYVFVKLTFKMEAKAQFAFVTISSSGKAKFDVTTTFMFSPTLTGTLNLGADRIASVGGGLSGTAEIQFKIPFSSMSDALSVILKGSIVGNITLLGFTHDIEKPLVSVNIYPGTSGRAATLGSCETSDFRLIERPANTAPLLMSDGSGFDFYRANTYSDTAPQLLQLNDGSWLLVWLDAAPERATADMSALYYSVSTDGTVWSEPAMVSDDGTGDFMPSLVLAGNGTPAVVWQNDSVVYASEELDLDTRIKSIEIAAAVFNAETGTFGESVALTSENEVCELAVQAAPSGNGVAVCWLENTENSLYMASGTNAIHTIAWDAETGTWGEDTLVAEGLTTLANFSAGEIGDAFYVAYSSDSETSTSVSWHNLTAGTTGVLTAASTPADLQICSDKLYWSDAAGLYSWNGSTSGLESAILADSQFTMICGNGFDLALLTYGSGMQSEYFASSNASGTWNEPVPVTDYGMSLGTPSAVLTGSTLHWAAGRSVVDSESGLRLNQNDLVVDSYTFTSRIEVSETAFVSLLADPDATVMEVSVDLVNAGMGESGLLKAVFCRDGSVVGESGLYRVNEEKPSDALTELGTVSPGETVWTIANYTLPEDGEEHELEVHITDASGETEYGIARVTIPGKKPDLTVTDATIVRTDDGALITATVLNQGKKTAADVTVALTQEGTDYTDSLSIGDLPAGESRTVAFTVPADTLTAESIFDYKRFTITASTEEEVRTGDNDADVLLQPLMAESITLVGDRELAIDVGESYTYSYELKPAGAVNQLVAWMSSDTSILTVEDGVVTAVKPGTAKLTVLGVDSEGKAITDSVYVTVNGDVEVSVTGITASANKTDIKIGETAVFTAQVLPEDSTNKLVEWLISDESLVSAVISPDTLTLTLTGVSEGTVEVVARTIDGGYPSAAMNLEIHADMAPVTVTRIAGADRIGTSLGLADQLKKTLGVAQFDTVIVASALNFPDALTGSYLAAVKSAPILLTYEAANARIREYIEANLADDGTVYILGGSTAVSAGFEDSVKALDRFNVIRLAGSDRFGTNLAIMEEAGGYSDQPILIATALDFADSLSASAAGLPMVLVYGSLRADQKEFLAKTSGEFIIVGGEAAVSAKLEAELKAIGSVKRLAGAGRYQTSVLVAQEFFGDAPGCAVLAYARNFPDGLCAGPLANALHAPLILTDNYDPSAADFYVKGVSTGFVIGGSGLISDIATRAIFDLSTSTPIH